MADNNQKKWWETTGGILVIISLVMTIFLSWGTCKEKLFGKFSKSDFVGEWNLYDEETDKSINGLSIRVISNSKMKFRKNGTFIKQTDLDFFMVLNTSILGTDNITDQKFSAHDIETTGTWTLEGEYFTTYIEKTDFLEKMSKTLGVDASGNNLVLGAMKDKTTQYKIINVDRNSMLFENVENPIKKVKYIRD